MPFQNLNRLLQRSPELVGWNVFYRGVEVCFDESLVAAIRRRADWPRACDCALPGVDDPEVDTAAMGRSPSLLISQRVILCAMA
jgi:hypothetical protein